MKKVTYDGVDYPIKDGELRKYDYYFYKGDLYEELPEKTLVDGYFVVECNKVGYCKRDLGNANLLIVAGVSVLCVCIGGFFGARALQAFNVEVPHFEWTKNKDNVIGDLDDGVVKASRKLSYSQYATYDGESVSMWIDSKDSSAEVQLVYGETSSSYVPVADSYNIPIGLGIEPQDVVEVIMNYKKGDKVIEYPVTVEYLQNEVPTIEMGNEDDYALAHTQPTEEETVVSDINEYQETNIDFENFYTIDISGSGYKEQMVRESETGD